MLLIALYVNLPSLSWTKEPCRSVFNEISEKLSEINISQYTEQDSYIRFVEELEGTNNMNYVFQKVSKELGSVKMRTLQWQEFKGTPEDFKDLKEFLSLDVINKYKEMEGYIRLANEKFESDMTKTYQNVSAVLGGSDSTLMKQLAWQQYQGLVSEFNDLRSKILNQDGSIKEEYKEMKGYAKFAKKYFNNDMTKTYNNVSAVLGGSDSDLMKQLAWQQYIGLVSEFNDLRSKILNQDGSIKEEYKGMEGYAKFAKKYFNDDMLKAYKNVSAVLGGSNSDLMKQLAWQQYQGLVSEFNNLRSKILNQDGSIKEEYKGMEGYAKFAKKYFNNDMQKAYKNVSAVLGGSNSDLMKQLGWQQYQGLVSEFNKLRSKILNQDGSIKEEYKGMEGYAKFAKKYFNDDMKKAYKNVSAVLGGSNSDLMKQLGWQQYQGSVSEFNKLMKLNKDGSIKEEYKGMEGYAKFAKKYFNDDMQRAYKNVSAVLGGASEMKKLGWKNFEGTVDQFQKLKELFERNQIEELKGKKGLSRVAKEIFKENTRKAYKMVSSLSEYLLGSWEAFNTLGWK